MGTSATAAKSRQRAREHGWPRFENAGCGWIPSGSPGRSASMKAAVDIEFARDTLEKAKKAVAAAELEVAAGIGRLVAEKLTLTEVAQLTGIDQPTVRRLRHMTPEKPSYEAAASDRTSEA